MPVVVFFFMRVICLRGREFLRLCPLYRRIFLRVSPTQPLAVTASLMICVPWGGSEGNIEGEFQSRTGARKGSVNPMGILWLILIIVGWVVLQAYVLPKFGIST